MSFNHTKKDKVVNTTASKVLTAVEENPELEPVFRTLYPDLFVDNTRFCKIGSVLIRANTSCFYGLFVRDSKVVLLNITHSAYFDTDRGIATNALHDTNNLYVTVSEFKTIIGAHAKVSDFTVLDIDAVR